MGATNKAEEVIAYCLRYTMDSIAKEYSRQRIAPLPMVVRRFFQDCVKVLHLVEHRSNYEPED